MHRRHVLRGLTASGLIGALGSSLPNPSLLGPPAGAETPPGRWMRLESENFVIYSSASEAKARQETAALQAFHALLRKLIPGPQPRVSFKLPVYFAPTDRDFDLTAPGMPPSVGGFYTPSLEEIRAVVSASMGQERQRDAGSEGRAFDQRLILFHEYVHHFQYANVRQAYPPWYVEGLAEYLSTADFTPDGCRLGKAATHRAAWLLGGDWLGIDKLLTKRTSELSSKEGALFYAQAWLATHMLLSKAELSRGFDRYVRALADGGDLLGAFEPAFGMTPAAFDKTLRAYRDGGITIHVLAGVTIDPNAPVTVSRLPRSADELLMPTAYARSAPGKAEDTLKRIRSEAKKYPDDAYARKALATAEVWLGDLAAARILIDGALKAAPDDAELLHLSGLCELRSGYVAKDDGRIAASAGSFLAAYRLDPTRAASLFRYAEARAQGPAGFDKSALDALLEAWGIAPQADSISLMLAQALMRHDRHAEAVVVLRPLTSDAHGGEGTKFAVQLMAAARDKQPLTTLSFFGSARTGSEDR